MKIVLIKFEFLTEISPTVNFTSLYGVTPCLLEIGNKFRTKLLLPKHQNLRNRV